VRGRSLLVVLAFVALAVTPAFAQEPPRAPRPAEARREEAFRMVDAYVVSNLQESLGLTDEAFVKVLPLVKKLQTSRREHLLARARLLQELRGQMRSGTATEAEVRVTLQRLKDVEGGGSERVRAGMAELDAALTPLQQAKYRLLELEVEQRMRELMGRARPRPGGRGTRE
jgi:hypothetical protein